MVTFSGAMPGTDEATRLTIARVCASPSARPGWSLRITEAVGTALSRTKTLASGVARWTRASATASISSIERASSVSRAWRRRSPSTARLTPMGSWSRIW